MVPTHLVMLGGRTPAAMLSLQGQLRRQGHGHWGPGGLGRRSFGVMVLRGGGSLVGRRRGSRSKLGSGMRREVHVWGV